MGKAPGELPVCGIDYFCPVHPPAPVGLDCSGDVDRAKQAFKDECDINVIMKRYEQSGVIDPLVLEQRQAVWGEFSDGGDFMELQERIVLATRLFDGLPASVRSRFNNNPGVLIEFLSDPANDAEAVRLGILAAPQPPAAPPPEGGAAGSGGEPPPA